MTLEELDIVVQANVAQALTEIKKILPQVKKTVKQVQGEFSKLNIKDIKANVDMSQAVKEVQKAKKEIQKVFDPNDTTGMTIELNGAKLASKEITGIANNMKSFTAQIGTAGNAYDKLRAKISQASKEADSGITQNISKLSGYKKQLDDLYKLWGQGKVSLGEIQDFKANNASAPNNSNLGNSTATLNAANIGTPNVSVWDTLRQKIESAKSSILEFKNSLNSVGNTAQLEQVKYQISEIEEKLQKVENGEIKLDTKDIIEAEAELENLNQKKNN